MYDSSCCLYIQRSDQLASLSLSVLVAPFKHSSPRCSVVHAFYSRTHPQRSAPCCTLVDNPQGGDTAHRSEPRD